MGSERREQIRITLLVKAAIFFPDGFILNVPVIDFSSGGIRLEIPIMDRLPSGKDGLLKLYFQPHQFLEGHPYMLEIPCRLIWTNDKNIGIEFLTPDMLTRQTIGDLLQTHTLNQENGHG